MSQDSALGVPNGHFCYSPWLSFGYLHSTEASSYASVQGLWAMKTEDKKFLSSSNLKEAETYNTFNTTTRRTRLAIQAPPNYQDEKELSFHSVILITHTKTIAQW